MTQFIVSNSNVLISLAAAASAFFAVLVLVWPYLARDTLSARLAIATGERAAIRVRERAKLNASQGLALRAEPKPLFQRIVYRMNLAAEAEDSALVQQLRMAGYRGKAPIITFVAVRVMTPAVAFIVAALYSFVIVRPDHPFFVNLLGVMLATCLGFYAPALYLKNKIAKRQQAILRAWPDGLDLMLICVQSGMGVESAFRKVAEEISGRCIELAEELSLTTAELSYLPDRRTAFENLASRTGLDNVKAVVTSLIQAEKYGTPVGQALRVLAQENRDTRMSEAEKKAAALPPKLTVPMILFFLPVLFAVILAPAIIQVMRLP